MTRPDFLKLYQKMDAQRSDFTLPIGRVKGCAVDSRFRFCYLMLSICYSMLSIYYSTISSVIFLLSCVIFPCHLLSKCYFYKGLVLSYVIFLLSILTSVLSSVISCTQLYFLLFEVRHE